MESMVQHLLSRPEGLDSTSSTTKTKKQAQTLEAINREKESQGVGLSWIKTNRSWDTWVPLRYLLEPMFHSTWLYVEARGADVLNLAPECIPRERQCVTYVLSKNRNMVS